MHPPSRRAPARSAERQRRRRAQPGEPASRSRPPQKKDGCPVPTGEPDPDPGRVRAAPPVAAPGPRAGRQSSQSVDRLLQRCPGGELRHLAGLDLDLLAGGGIAALTGAALRHTELPETRENDITPTLQCTLDGLE